MNESHQPQADALQEAIGAFRQMTVPERPSDAEVLLRIDFTQAKTLRPVSISLPSNRRLFMRFMVPSAAAVLLMLGGLGWFLLGTSSSVALADVTKAAEKHKLVKYKMTQTNTTSDGNSGTSDYTNYADLKALRIRSELVVNLTPDVKQYFVSVQDTPNDRTLTTISHDGVVGTINPRKDATLRRVGEERKKMKSFLENLAEFQQKNGATSGKDTLSGREMIRFRVEADGNTKSLWVDAKTKLPFRVETESVFPTGTLKEVQTDFEWDPPLPKGFTKLDELFSIKPPEGYTLDDQTKKEK